MTLGTQQAADQDREGYPGGFRARDRPEQGHRLAERRLAGLVPGKPIGETSTLVARFCWTWDACHRLGPAARPGELKANAVGLAVPPPTGPGDATDVDLIVSRDRPHWPNEVQARRENACIGPFRNETGDLLTDVVVKRRAGHHPAPGGAIGPRPAGREDEIRALGSALAPAGLLWLIEQRMSRSGLALQRLRGTTSFGHARSAAIFEGSRLSAERAQRQIHNAESKSSTLRRSSSGPTATPAGKSLRSDQLPETRPWLLSGSGS